MSQEVMRPIKDYVAGIVELLPTIKFQMQESPTNEAKIRLYTVINIMEREIHNFYEDPLESIICGTSMALFNQGIVTDIKIEPLTEMSIPNICIFLVFRNVTVKDKNIGILSTHLEKCDQKWGNLLRLPGKERVKQYEEAIKGLISGIKEGIRRSKQATNREETYYQAGFIQWSMGKKIGNETEFLNDDPGSVLCGISRILFDNGIVIDIAIERRDGCLVFSFRDTTPDDKSLIIDECIEKWVRLFV